MTAWSGPHVGTGESKAAARDLMASMGQSEGEGKSYGAVRPKGMGTGRLVERVWFRAPGAVRKQAAVR